MMCRLATAGCDAVVKIWEFSEEHNRYVEIDQLKQHRDWVRDVAFAPSLGLARTYLATASQDRTVLIWTQDTPNDPWKCTPLLPGAKPEDRTKFADTVWRVSWSVSGNVEDTTANRMEQVAALRALETLEPGQSVTMGSGSEYLIKGMRDWLPGWKAKGWRCSPPTKASACMRRARSTG